MNIINLLYLIGAWLGYFVLHSALASTAAKAWVAGHWPRFNPYYRLAYNLAATLLLVPPLWIIHNGENAPLWTWQGAGWWLANGLALAALIGFWWSLRYYDMGDFLGLKQSRPPDQTRRFTLSPFHRYVRHPWYSFGLVIIWTRDMDPAWLVSCIAITLYFAVGSRLEEQKLLTEFGDIYHRYQRRVPGFIPIPGRYLTRAEAAEIVAVANKAPG
jgi:protein-S-isoprenylcysteine O-methyltransferase Ste14